MSPAPAKANRWAVLGVIMLGTFMAILDISIVNVALPHMMSSFGVNRDQIEWVATGFMLTSAAAMPAIGWITTRMDYKTLYLTCLTIFTVASALCAAAWSYESLVAARILQAIGAGAIQPIGMAMVAELFEPHERGKALGIWGTGIMVAPALGPTLGGYLTDAYSWRTIFAVNIPVGVITLLAALIIMDPIRTKAARRPFDLPGYAMLALALVAGLTGLSNGHEQGWDSTYIHTCFALAIIGTVLFIATELVVEHPLLDLKLFLIRNFSLSILLAIFRAVGLFGSVFLFPIFLQNLMGYTAVQAGLWMMPNALAVGVTMPIAGRLADRYSPRLLATVGSILVGLSLVVYGALDPLSGWQMLVLPQLVRGVGLGLMMSPLLAAALNSVPRHELPMASVFLNVSQNVGGSLGIAVLNTLVTNSIHVHAVRLGEALPVASNHFYQLAMRMNDLVFRDAHGVAQLPFTKVGYAMMGSIGKRAQVLGFQEGFVIAGVFLLIAVPFSLMLKPSAHHQPKSAAARKVEAETELETAMIAD